MAELILVALSYLFVICLVITCFHYFIHQQIRRRISGDSREEENSPAIVDGIIVGFGLDSYRLAVESLIGDNKIKGE